MSKPILCLDFDGVIHSYDSGWQGARVIPDPPVPEALEFIVESMKNYTVAIYSSRSGQWFGRRAMKMWLRNEYMKLAIDYETTPQWLLDRITTTMFSDPWWDEVEWSIKQLINQIQWPKTKPPALLTIDDRAYRFDGSFPSQGFISRFKPWNKQ